MERNNTIKRTPGPWEIRDVTTRIFINAAHDNVCIIPKDFFNWTIPEANAKLIAAAPDLLEACIEALKQLEKLKDYTKAQQDCHWKLVRAIKKAT